MQAKMNFALPIPKSMIRNQPYRLNLLRRLKDVGD